MASHLTPDILESRGPRVTELKILEVECPNCKQKLDVTNLKEGTKIKCPSCKNVTWTPSYKQEWWQRGVVYILSLIVSFGVGVAASVVANKITTNDSSEAIVQTEKVPNKR